MNFPYILIVGFLFTFHFSIYYIEQFVITLYFHIWNTKSDCNSVTQLNLISESENLSMKNIYHPPLSLSLSLMVEGKCRILILFIRIFPSEWEFITICSKKRTYIKKSHIKSIFTLYSLGNLPPIFRIHFYLVHRYLKILQRRRWGCKHCLFIKTWIILFSLQIVGISPNDYICFPFCKYFSFLWGKVSSYNNIRWIFEFKKIQLKLRKN